ncbi:MAG TPA: OmpA family protein [Saprospiraceae bacterium]|nr:OmpA family protein [Saprospiraceae bacterium]HNT20703.1 OmpA family protein [Saprospiraceae bacterium]
MAINLLELLQSQVGGELVGQASKFLGETEVNTGKAVGSIFPTLLGSLVGKASTESGSRGILDFIKTNNIDGSVLNSLGGLFSGGQATDSLLGSGGGILKFLVGDKLGSIVDVISNVSGVKTGTSSSLLKMAAPLLMGFVGKFVKEKALDAMGLKNLLGGQREFISKGIPGALTGLLGLATNAGGGAPKMPAGPSSTTGSSNLLKWALPILLLLAVIYFFGRKGCDRQMETTPTEMVDSAKLAAEAAAAEQKRIADSIAASRSVYTLPGGISLNTKKGSFTDKFVSFFADSLAKVDPKMAFTFDGVHFKTGSDSLTMESGTQLDELASVMTAYSGVNIRVVGHTDNVGDAAMNKKLSDARAKSVKAYLVGKGIAGRRIETLGMGQASPIGDNNTEEGKAMNRRVEVFVTRK